MTAWPEWVALSVQLSVGSWLAVAAGAKLLDVDQSRRALAAYTLMPTAVVAASPFAFALVEVVLGVALVFGLAASWTFAATSALFAAFAAAMAVDLLAGRRHSCGCGLAEAPIGWPLVVRNMAIAVLMVALAASGGPSVPVDIRATVVAIAGSAVVAILLAHTYRQTRPVSSG